ncbi:MAG: tRNA (adenosine(37)-N6)-threonylcarbamoyltransferase complex dimerization subunit type 1 TsaB [Deltaproteobacteria bacterium]|nr:tRNA (adenosine(37)-N6)-threonylcarbamoyltransferase complex dimerization subunit type 1 TsaB [Deltaproteobacteria bacterium]MBW2053364.1 tRNA (adenosine(37)-N6)-threonylcarbamoyltransferase complex dimerization subunit type 1 TsaB [Deltaproteobacteria bacterium]MBW2140149.1 tRNA (adenosine(37)-N6)-threonylcarbamoyltransferase complex dimerization subunit type 1 TsaB [Deltaproteobacteria bacterium]
MITLALETSTALGSVALVDEAGTLAESIEPEGLTHSRTLLPSANRLLSETGLTLQDLDLIAVTVGPGSFTGLRIGLSVAKGLAWAAGKPLVGVPSLDTLAQNLPPEPHQFCPMIDARKGEVYAALYRFNSNETIRRLTDFGTFKPDKLAELIQAETVFFGDGARTWGKVLSEGLGPRYIRANKDLDFPHAAVTARLGMSLFAEGTESDPALIRPIYIRPSEAELSWAARHKNSGK